MNQNEGTVLIIDDEPANLSVLGGMLAESGYDVRIASSGEEGLKSVFYSPPDIILLDVMMPKMDGFETIRLLKLTPEGEKIPVIFITALDQTVNKVNAFRAGGVDYVTKPFASIEVLHRIATHIELKRYRDQLEAEVRDRTNQLELINIALVSSLESANSWRDDDCAEHIKRVGEYSGELAGAIGLSKAAIQEIKRFAPIHDIGKIAIPDNILKKPDKLTVEEFEVMKRHCNAGSSMLDNKGVPQKARNIVKHHHERWNGKGYPDGLAGTGIPLEARIVALADVYDALRSKRIYKEAFSPEKTASMIISESGKHFDPELVEAFKYKRDVFEGIAERFPDEKASDPS